MMILQPVPYKVLRNMKFCFFCTGREGEGCGRVFYFIFIFYVCVRFGRPKHTSSAMIPIVQARLATVLATIASHTHCTHRTCIAHASHTPPAQPTAKLFFEQRWSKRLVHFMGRSERDSVHLPEGSSTSDGRSPGVTVELPKYSTYREVRDEDEDQAFDRQYHVSLFLFFVFAFWA